MAQEQFPDPVAAAASMDRLDQAATAVASLASVFTNLALDPAETGSAKVESMDTLPPEMMKMLEAAMAKQGKKTGSGGTVLVFRQDVCSSAVLLGLAMMVILKRGVRVIQ
jgi:hypothetical protein